MEMVNVFQYTEQGLKLMYQCYVILMHAFGNTARLEQLACDVRGGYNDLELIPSQYIH